MAHELDPEIASSRLVAAELGRRLNELRLAQDLTQQQLAERAGVSRRTIVKMADDGTISLDSFIRIVQALGLASHLTTLLPDPQVRPVEQARLGRRRRRASGAGGEATAAEWRWADEFDRTDADRAGGTDGADEADGAGS